MDSARRNKLIVRWLLLTAGLIALFWASWYLVNGSVPVVTSIKMTPKWTVALPFGISHWWDVLMGPIWSTILILFFTNEQIRRNEDLAFGLVFGLVYGLVVFELAYGLVVYGLVYGLVVCGLVVCGLAYVLAFGLVKLIQILALKNFWTKISDWLLARN